MANFEVDFSPIGRLGEIARQGQQQQQVAAWLQSQGLPPNLNLAQIAMANQRDQRDFTAKQEEHQREQRNTDRLFEFQKQQADAAGRGYTIREYDKPDGTRGIVRIENATGKPTPLDIDGGNLSSPTGGSGTSIPPAPANADPKEWRKLHTKGIYEAQEALPKIETSTETALKQIVDIRAHPGKRWGTGMTSASARIPGTPMMDFSERVDQLKGKSFLEAYESLKGGGAISEPEGAKATAAIARLNTAKSEKDFDAALNDLEEVIQTGRETARQKAKGYRAPPKPPQQKQGGNVQPPPAAIQALRDKPALRAAFDAKYGAGAADQALGSP